ncbi:hypothetical protein QQF64_011259 [Cirrhinus molitorella]|uniref:Uncharacterized protein n=1 Tax=Cirrhinus molitorella TaxID=172907 RepID=A0ABR3LZM6_9TELE
MSTRQSASEKRKKLAKERLTTFREKLYSNPELHEEYRRKERERYQKRKLAGQIKKTEELTKKQHEKKTRQWRDNSKLYYKRKKQLKAILETTPSSEDDESLQLIQANEIPESPNEGTPNEQPVLSQQHNAIATWAHLDPVLRSIREEHPNARNIHFISDGPTSQYRNKTNFYLASTLPFIRGFNHVTWNFTEASHGKGAPDGVGGALKNLADRIVSYGTSIPDADTLFEQLDLNSSVRLFKITEDDVKKSAKLVPPDLKTVPGMMQTHQMISTKPGLIYTREVSCFCNFICGCYSPKEFDFRENEASEEENAEPVLEVGKWVLVQYDGELFPGTITQIVDGQYEVDTMSCAGSNRFFIPSKRYEGEKVWYYFDDIKAVIPEPQPATSSAQHFCVLPEIWAKYTKKCV